MNSLIANHAGLHYAASSVPSAYCLLPPAHRVLPPAFRLLQVQHSFDVLRALKVVFKGLMDIFQG